MQTSVFLARLIGPVGLAIAIGVLANGAVYKELAREVLRSRALIYLSGLLTMTAGLAVVLSHNVWTTDWRVLVTLLGWLATIGGAFRIMVPQGTESIGRRVLEHPRGLTIAGVVWLVLGALLSFFGYFR
ncbi:MAG: hypothetical protein IT537_25820 [Hyphomicrobiales bacterium]|nr:hypothetical protein [Hyphomicrobiales bacterium]